MFNLVLIINFLQGRRKKTEPVGWGMGMGMAMGMVMVMVTETLSLIFEEQRDFYLRRKPLYRCTVPVHSVSQIPFAVN